MLITSAVSYVAGEYSRSTFSEPTDSIVPIFMMNMITIVLEIDGSVTWIVCFHRPAPSMRAASYRS